ncbi:MULTISPECIES: TIGR03943 family protein [unclassified Streptomyces]|uniref:TIGR03943 family putative permease subunit n=1 Tax=unclassified Streptomyces TaxID=2593676 RepID=UPI00225B5E0C|nr:MULTISPECIES: TIGR03943 family protein [unclassified Streptomyces]MCX5332735.1 TIGR03943 family protein [Streptomyces sp. NBC_00140]MCX5362133.1 TIGR03943 family protein [Streptomyces sp. NBC_00124]
MRRYGPALLLVLVGAAILRISAFSALYLRYVQAGLRPYLVVSGAALVLLGIVMAVVRHSPDDGHDDDGDHHDHDHDHAHHGPRVAWLLTLPALALLLFPPPALGSYSAEREAAQRAAQGVGVFPALPAGDPVELGVGEFSSRAIYDSGRSLRGRTVRMTGFVTHGDDGTWYVTRLLVSCCAADATTSKVEIRGADALPADTWVTVTGTWHPEGKLGTDGAWPPVLDAASVQQMKQPADPYEKR